MIHKELWLVFDFKQCIRVFLLILPSTILQTSCMVGPNFHSPTPPKVKRFTETPLPKKTASAPSSGGQSQTFITDKDIPLLWWELFIRRKLINSSGPV